MARTFVSYLRVSTDKQGRSGLGLEAQQSAIAAFLQPGDHLLAPPYIEIESGKKADRPQLRAALEHCKRTGATLLIARLDRLARSVWFISSLMQENVPFLACDMPTATPFMLHMYAAVAEEESRAVSRRTKAALAAAKARGTKLGGDRGYRPPAPPASGLGGAGKQERAVLDAHRAASAIEAIRAELGADLSLQALARELTSRGVPTRTAKPNKRQPRQVAWTATAVRRALARV